MTLKIKKLMNETDFICNSIIIKIQIIKLINEMKL
jgi:hypothetical protein